MTRPNTRQKETSRQGAMAEAHAKNKTGREKRVEEGAEGNRKAGGKQNAGKRRQTDARAARAAGETQQQKTWRKNSGRIRARRKSAEEGAGTIKGRASETRPHTTTRTPNRRGRSYLPGNITGGREIEMKIPRRKTGRVSEEATRAVRDKQTTPPITAITVAN